VATIAQALIVGGDPKEKLMPQLDDIGRIPFPDRPPFIIEVATPEALEVGRENPRVTAHVFINGLVAEDGSGSRWLISGEISREIVRYNRFLEPFRSFTGYYDTKTRHGHLEPQR
jgi:hypothetical protein